MVRKISKIKSINELLENGDEPDEHNSRSKSSKKENRNDAIDKQIGKINPLISMQLRYNRETKKHRGTGLTEIEQSIKIKKNKAKKTKSKKPKTNIEIVKQSMKSYQRSRDIFNATLND